MKHSAQMREELNFVVPRVKAHHYQAFTNFPENYHQVLILHRQELMEYKVKLEELLEKTDIKEQSIKMNCMMLLKQCSYFDCFQGRANIYNQNSGGC